MKKGFIVSTVLLLVGTGPLVFGDSYYGGRYNPQNPYGSKQSREQKQSGSSQVYNPQDYNNPNTVKPQNLGSSYGIEPRRWYDSQKQYQDTYEKTVQPPRTLTDPYRQTRPAASEMLTSPFEKSGPQSPEVTTTTNELTAPVSR